MKKIISVAPGRTCLFGDHQDYLGLPIIACAINKHITLTAIENNDDFFLLNMPDINQTRKINLNADLNIIDKNDHFLSAIQVLKRHKCYADKGYNIVIKGTIPINSGTSSSSALVVAWVQFLIKAFGDESLLNPKNISEIAFEAEVVEHGNPGGRMDQFSIGFGNIIYLETGDKFSYKVFEKQLKGLIMAESGVPKDTVGLLQKLKTNAWAAIKEVQKHIADFTIETANYAKLDYYLNFLSDDLKPYLRAAIGNYKVTITALEEFKRNNLDIHKIGNLMNKHHQYLRDDLKITVPKIDEMIDVAINAGALGAKIVGSGGGGSIAILSEEKDQQRIIEALQKVNVKNIYPVQVEQGAYLK